eukprot:2426712-Alexandrium_andersonii.AAC.1
MEHAALLATNLRTPRPHPNDGHLGSIRPRDRAVGVHVEAPRRNSARRTGVWEGFGLPIALDPGQEHLIGDMDVTALSIDAL